MISQYKARYSNAHVHGDGRFVGRRRENFGMMSPVKGGGQKSSAERDLNVVISISSEFRRRDGAGNDTGDRNVKRRREETDKNVVVNLLNG